MPGPAVRSGSRSVPAGFFVVPPVGHIGPITPEQRQQLIANSLVAGVYENAIDRESAYEKLKSRVDSNMATHEQAREAAKDVAKEAANAAALNIAKIKLQIKMFK